MKRFVIAAVLVVAAASAHAARFAVQLGAFATPAEAQEWVLKVVNIGVPAYAEQRSDKTLLRAGPFGSKDEAQAAIAKIRNAGLFTVDVSTEPLSPRAEPAAQHWSSGSTVIVAHQTSSRTGYRIEFSFVPCSRLPPTVSNNVPRDPNGYVVFAYDHPGHSPNIGCGVVMKDEKGSVTAVNWADDSEQAYFLSSDMQRGE